MADNRDLRGKSSNAAGWLASLEAHDVRYLILDVRSDADLLRQVGRRPGWRLDMADGESAIYARDAAEAPSRGGKS